MRKRPKLPIASDDLNLMGCTVSFSIYRFNHPAHAHFPDGDGDHGVGLLASARGGDTFRQRRSVNVHIDS
mgnify:CR=1 FL=1